MHTAAHHVHSYPSPSLGNDPAVLVSRHPAARARLKEAVKECGSALEVSPGSIKALRHRAKALEKQGMYKAALTDIQVCTDRGQVQGAVEG